MGKTEKGSTGAKSSKDAKGAKIKFNRIEKSWIMYDWANSVFATIMMAAIFPIYFSSVAGAAGQEGDYWWGIGSSISMAIAAICAPIIGAVVDFRGYKKKVFVVFLVLGIGFTLFSALSNNWKLLLVGYAISNIGFAASCLIYDSFLTDVTTPDRMDKVSGFGFAFGYIGGSTIPFLMSIALITFGEKFGIGMALAVKISLFITAAWWGLFSIPFLKNVHQKHDVGKPTAGAFRETFAAVGRTAKKIVQNKSVCFFILAYFFYIDGVGTVIKMATSYGATLGLDSTGMILALLVTQLVAFPASMIFSSLSRRFGSLKMLRNAVTIYMFICVFGFFMGFGLERELFGLNVALTMFWIMAALVGTVQGGIQAISRSYYGKIIPPENSGEFFGFFDIFGKFAAILGPLLYSLIKGVTGYSSFGILSILVLFVIAQIVFTIGRKHLDG